MAVHPHRMKPSPALARYKVPMAGGFGAQSLSTERDDGPRPASPRSGKTVVKPRYKGTNRLIRKSPAPIKTETSKMGKAVGKDPSNIRAREIKVQLNASQKGHQRKLVRPIHQGGTFSHKFLVPKLAGASDSARSRRGAFGSL